MLICIHNFTLYKIKAAQNPTGVDTQVHSQGKLILTNKVVTPLHTKSSCQFLSGFERIQYVLNLF